MDFKKDVENSKETLLKDIKNFININPKTLDVVIDFEKISDHLKKIMLMQLKLTVDKIISETISSIKNSQEIKEELKLSLCPNTIDTIYKIIIKEFSKALL